MTASAIRPRYQPPRPGSRTFLGRQDVGCVIPGMNDIIVSALWIGRPIKLRRLVLGRWGILFALFIGRCHACLHACCDVFLALRGRIRRGRPVNRLSRIGCIHGVSPTSELHPAITIPLSSKARRRCRFCIQRAPSDRPAIPPHGAGSGTPRRWGVMPRGVLD